MKHYIFAVILVFATLEVAAQQDSAGLEKLRKESGIDPTRVATRGGYSLLMFDQAAPSSQVNNRFSLTLGVNRWSLALKTDLVSKVTGGSGEGFKTGMGDIRFSVLNAFFVKGRSALAASAEFSVPTGRPGFGSQYLSLTPALTYSYTIDPSLILAVQPQYSFDLMKDPAFPQLQVITIRSFIAKFTKSGYFFVFEPRPVFDLANKHHDMILSPIAGKSLGGGFNLIALVEYPLSKRTRSGRGTLYQLGFNKNF